MIKPKIKFNTEGRVSIEYPKGKAIHRKYHFEFSQFEQAFRTWLDIRSFVIDTDQMVRLVVSFHEYSDGFWIEFKKKKLANKEDFILQSTHAEFN